MTSQQLSAFRLKNFKAVRDSGKIVFTPLTAFIGYNGSGKSSIVEGLSTFQAIVEDGLDKAMQEWRGFEYVWNQSVPHTAVAPEGKRASHSNPMAFEIWGYNSDYHHDYHATMQINLGPKEQELFIQSETLEDGILYQVTRNDRGSSSIEGDLPYVGPISETRWLGDGNTTFSNLPHSTLHPQSWQFTTLEAHAMGHPVPQSRATKEIRLSSDGSNLAEYLLSIRKLDENAFDGIVETLQSALPYVNDLSPILTSELERAVYLQFAEDSFKVPGWLMSTGTLRILALLALLRHPKPAPLIVIEEIENGLDPRTVHIIIEEIRRVVESGLSQVILTSHSPYLLDLLDLSHIVLVERVNGEPIFTRPSHNVELQKWTKRFGPGKLYTMGRLGQEDEA